MTSVEESSGTGLSRGSTDWVTTQLGRVAQFSKGRGLPKSALTPGGSEPCIHYGELFTHYGPSISTVTSRTSKAASATLSRANDVLMPTSDVTPRGLAKASCVLMDGVIIGGDALIIRPDPAKLNGVFLAYLIRQSEAAILNLVRGSTVFHIYASDLSRLELRLPRVEEQVAIVETLREVDDLIASLDALITKKRDIKQAAMQQLLTGKSRLPGHTAGWGSTRLGRTVEFSKGRGLPKSALNPGGSAPCIHYGELFTHYGPTISTITSRTFDAASAALSRANDVLMPTSDVTPRGLAKASCVLVDGVIIGGDALIIRPDPTKINGVFLAYLIRQSETAVLNLVRGSTVFHIYATDLSRLELHLPKVEEQISIAEVLMDIDAELEKLAVKRAKVASIKEGMMQQLLTGRIRLV